jgi:hypothetical protein
LRRVDMSTREELVKALEVAREAADKVPACWPQWDVWDVWEAARRALDAYDKENT